MRVIIVIVCSTGVILIVAAYLAVRTMSLCELD